MSSERIITDMMQSLKLDLSGTIVDTESKMIALADELCALPLPRRKLYLDFEGVNLCREGKCCIGQLTVPLGACILLDSFGHQSINHALVL